MFTNKVNEFADGFRMQASLRFFNDGNTRLFYTR
ncbi:Uncharacterised protein [Mycobacteroides abscessus subsp. massiliense]|nr:Uncharacterised protein [Mycobacteroides abscessus subsp. massiliense]